MNEKSLIAQILEHAETINKLKNDINTAFKHRQQNPAAHKKACEIFHAQYNKLAFPGGLSEGLELLKQQDYHMIITAIAYLKADPYFFRSGYNKQEIIRKLKNATFTKEQIEQLQEIILNALKNPHIFTAAFGGLARKIQDAQFKSKIEAIIQESDDQRAVRRAKKLLYAMNS